MGVLIDTDVFVEIERGLPMSTISAAVGSEQRGISVVTVSELLHGVHRASGDVRARRSGFVERVLAGFEALPITEAVARVHAELGAQMVSAGVRIGANDLWIGATAMAHGLGVLTGNVVDFERVPGLRVVGLRG